MYTRVHMHRHLLPLVVIIALVCGAAGYAYLQVARQAAPAQAPEPEAAREIIRDENDFYTIEAAYPREPLDTAHAMEAFVRAKVAQVQEEWKIGGTLHQAEQQVAADFPDRPAMRYQFVVAYDRYASPKLGTVSYVFQLYQYTGGAHGGTVLQTFIFGPRGAIGLEDVLAISDGGDIELSRLLREKLAATLGDYGDARMLDEGLGLAFLREDGSFDPEACGCDGFFFGSNFQHLIVKDEGLTFVMDEYQVAPYAAGHPEATMSWAELAPFLAEGWELPLD